jgi:UDP-glucose 4-epimerase
MKKILITGSNGLIGSKTIKMLKTSNEVYAISHTNFSEENVKTISLDFNEKINFKSIPDDIDTIIHLAQSPHFKDFPDKSLNVFNTNTYSTIQLLDFARQHKVKHFIYASSGSIYGMKNGPFNEDDPIKLDSEINFYLTSKIASELILENYKKLLSIVILRFFFVYGPKQSPQMLMPHLINNVIANKEIILHNYQGIKINPIYVDDAVEAIVSAMSLNGFYKINVAGNEVCSIKNIGETIGSLLNKIPLFKIIESATSKNLIANITSMKKILSIPKIGLKEGLKKTINCLK